MKLCVLAKLFHHGEQGELELTEPVAVRNEFRSIVDGSIYRLDPHDDSYPALFEAEGESRTLLQLAEPMITHSSNLATNLLVNRLLPECITDYMAEIGACDLRVLRGVEDHLAFEQGLNNTVTAEGLCTLLTKIAKGELPGSEAMLQILLEQTHRNCLPAGVPADVPVANKPGWHDGVCHDAAILFPPKRDPYVLVVLTSGLNPETTGPHLIRQVSKAVYEHQY